VLAPAPRATAALERKERGQARAEGVALEEPLNAMIRGPSLVKEGTENKLKSAEEE